MRCSVVIPCWNGASLTRSCVESLLCQRGGHDLQILLVDNGSTDETPDLHRIDPRVTVLRQPRNLGFAGGVNAGIRAAALPFVLVLNNDTLAAPNLLDELHRALDQDPRIGAVAPLSNHVKGLALLPIGEAARDAAARAELAAGLAEAKAPLQDVDTLAGLCLLVRRSTFAEVGLFDERFGHGNFEDDDFCLRLRLHGYRLVIARRAFLHHEGHATFRALGLPIRDQIEQRRAQFVAKWQNDPAGRAVIAAMRGDVPQAAAEARAGQRIWPRWPDADLHLGRLAAARGDHGAAIAHFAALLRACPAHSDAALGLGLHQLAAGHTDAALRQLGWTVAHCELSEDSQIHLLRLLGELAHRNGQWAEAAANFGAAAELRPDDGELHNWCGVCRLALDDVAGAFAAFEAAIAADFPLAYTNRGICHHRNGDADRALADFAAALARLPDDPVAKANHAALAQQLAAAGRRAAPLALA